SCVAPLNFVESPFRDSISQDPHRDREIPPGIKSPHSWSMKVSAWCVKEKRLFEQNELTVFNEAVLPHLDAAYNLARWLSRNDHDAEDVVQEACLRAFKYWKGFSGRDCRSWLLAIVRNTYYSWLQKQALQPELTEDGELGAIDDG